MAPSPRPYTSLLLPSLLLLLLVSSNAVRAGATSRNHAAQDDHGEVDASGEAAEAGDDRCGEGGEGGDDECLMRRTLVAHTDYIYTQGGNHN
ncbi:phytosulfokines 4-like [Hordeum vulgare subsp. vulgare]|uniref:phytosulfokines 4-like n=1 Tax=Hordeum vulgare subsp. vulgare TaxID=112509 RepID=UPI000B467F2D|nr:phytosulfokines 4-like [Hordeum vulgare subsp. vulgare]KAI4996979.1 hypothetical protein ZWY2020_052321 [Hordeum vulgare]